MKQQVYRTPITSPHEEVHVLFETAADLGIGTDNLADLTGYGRDAILNLRRPNKHGHGNNPGYQMLKDVAQILGYEFKLVRTGWRGQEEHDD